MRIIRLIFIGLVIGSVLFTPALYAKSFLDHCLHPSSEAHRQTILAVMIKMKVREHPNLANCELTAQLLREKWFLNIYPDPFEPARGPASDLSPIEDEVQIKILSVAKNQISDLNPIKRLTKLIQLNANFNPLSDLSPVANFKLLEEFSATEAQIADLTPIADLTRLRVLSLADNEIDNIEPLTNLVNLRAVYLSNNKLSDASALRDKKLEYLHLVNNRLTALDLSSSRDSLVLLDVSRNSLEAITGINTFTKIDAMNIADNRFSDLKDFGFLGSIRWLDIRRNLISDLSPLSHLTDLEYLYIAGNQICEIPEAIAEMQNEHLNSKGKWIRLKLSGADQQVGCSPPRANF